MINVNQDNSSLDLGIWTSYCGSQFKLRHTSNLKFQRVLARLQTPHKSQIAKGTLDPQTAKEVVCKAFSQALMTDWKDVVDSDGNQVPFSEESAYTALMNNSDLVEFIQEFSSNLSVFKGEEIAELGKN